MKYLKEKKREKDKPLKGQKNEKASHRIDGTCVNITMQTSNSKHTCVCTYVYVYVCVHSYIFPQFLRAKKFLIEMGKYLNKYFTKNILKWLIKIFVNAS